MTPDVPVTRSLDARSSGATRIAAATALSAVVLILAVACGPVDTRRSIRDGGDLGSRSAGAVVERSREEFGDGHAVLGDGPYRRTGLDALGQNVISVWRAEYYLFTESTRVNVSVEYVDRPLELPAWERITCEQLPVLVAPAADDTRVYARVVRDGHAFFFTFPSELDAPCRFVVRFLSEFEFFRGAVGADAIPPFPAVLDVS